MEAPQSIPENHSSDNLHSRCSSHMFGLPARLDEKAMLHIRMRSRQYTRPVSGALLLLTLFCVGLLGTIIMWTTDIFDSLIDDRLVLRNNSAAFEAWRVPPVKPLMRFRFFNYTNLDAYRRGDDVRLRVEEVGPYTYTEATERVNVVFHDNGTITYQNRRSYEFVPEETNGTLDDVIVTVNVPLMTTNYMMRKTNYFQRLPMAAGLRLLSPEPLHARTVREIFWGYTDPLTKVASIKMKDLKVGVLEQISHFGGRDHVDYYTTEECNRVDGSDGSKFPPPDVHPGGTLVIYHRDVCRRVLLVAHEYVSVFDGVPAIRFRPPPDLLADGDANPENACYCVPSTYDVCQPSGRMGVPIGGRTRFQFNVLVKDTFNNFMLKRLDEKLLPFLWLERELTGFPPELQKIFYTVSVTVPKIKLALYCISPALMLLTGVILLVWAGRVMYRLLREPLNPPEVYVMTRL
ncbi:Protein croquemort [Gryllus bimaculatus]|nr:Protein croquemort [Gryllus bimaculatus]